MSGTVEQPARPADDSRAGDEVRRPYIVGEVKVAGSERTAARNVLGDLDTPALDAESTERGYFDVAGSDRADNDPEFPVGAEVSYVLELTPAEAAEFAADPHNRYVELDPEHTPDTSPLAGGVGTGATAIPSAASLAYMRAAGWAGADAWHGRDVLVAVLDQGTTKAVRDYMGFTLVGRAIFGDSPAAGQELIAATDGRASGYWDHGCLTAPNAVPAGGRLLDCMVIDSAGKGSAARFAAAARWAADQGARIINYSFSGTDTSSVYDDVFTYLAGLGVQVFASAGNDNLNTINTPASYSRTYPNVHSSVAFDERNNYRGSFSNYHADASGCSPGVAILSLTPTAEVTSWQGTSGSSPHKARMCAQGATGGRIHPSRVGAALKANTRDTGQPRTIQGGGAYDLRRALTALGAVAAPPVRRQLCTNPSAETDLVGWSTDSTPASSAPARSNVVAPPSGVPGAYYGFTTISASGALRFYGPSFPVTPGQGYTAAPFMRRNRAQTVGSRCYIRWYNSAGATLGISADTTSPAVPFPGADTWHRLVAGGVAPAGAVTARGYVYISPTGDFTDTNADQVRVDGWLYETAADPALAGGPSLEPYFDGASPGATWDGAAHASTSTLVTPPPQQTPIIRSAHRATASNENATVITGADTAVGDVLVAFHALDWDTAGDMAAPTGTAAQSAWGSSVVTADRGTKATHLKAWTRKVTVAGAQRVIASFVASSDVGLIVVVLDGTTVDPAWIDGAAGAVGAAATAHIAPSVAPAGGSDLLLTAHATSDSGTSGKAVAAYTPPPGMVSALRQGSTPTAADSIASGEWLTLGVFTENRSAPGATGARTATSSASRPWAAVSIAVRGAPVRLSVELTPPRVATVVTMQRGVALERSGQTLDLASTRVRVRPYPLPVAKTATVTPIATRLTFPRVYFDRSMPVAPVPIRARFPDVLLVNMTVTPIRVRVGAIPPTVEMTRSTVLTERRRPIYVRPRKNLRFIAQEVLSRRFVSWDVDLLDPDIEWKINAATEITGRLRAEELYSLGLDEWAHYLHVEQDGRIRASGMMQPWSPGGPEIDVNFSGVTSYLHGLPYQGEFTLGNPVGVAIDPLDVYRHMWAHAQSYADGRLGVVLSATKSPVRIGEPERDVNFQASGGEQVSFTAGPYLLKPYDDTDMGREGDDLQKSTPFDYRESPYWNADKSDVVQWIELGWPRLGRRRDDLSFTEDQNLVVAFAPVENDDEYASEVIVLGSGEGVARVRGRYGRRVGLRVRRAKVIERKDTSSTARADAQAREETDRSAARLSFDEVHLKPRHRNAPFGSFAVGDDIPNRATVKGYGRVDILHRVVGIGWKPHAGELVTKTARSDTFTYSAATSGTGVSG